MTPEESRKLIEVVQANHARLNGCAGPHTWEVIETLGIAKNGEPIPKRVRCTRCQGEAQAVDAIRYENGVKHGFEAAKRGENVQLLFK